MKHGGTEWLVNPMSEAVLISIRPEWCEKIVNGKKTIELRKTKPKLELPFKCYIYCTYGLGLIERYDGVYPNMLLDQKVSASKIWGNCCNGKVIGEFVCDCFLSHCEMANADLAEQMGCVRREDILKYSGGKEVYGWHISDLKIYDIPKDISEFWVEGNQTFDYPPITKLKRPPQSWCYCMPLPEPPKED